MKRYSCEVIAEAGVNHNGELDLAIKLIDAASDAGADVVKFQTFSADKLVVKGAARAAYQERNQPGAIDQAQMLRALELPLPSYKEMQAYAGRRGIEFLSSPFDVDSARFLVGELGLKRLKLGSGEITNALLLVEAARLGVPLLVSTGMSFAEEVKRALGMLAFGYIASRQERPCREAFAAAFESSEGQLCLKKNVRLYHCTTNYPAAMDSVNLLAMTTMANEFRLPTGYSDHTLGWSVPVAAVALGAVSIEKHLTLDCTMDGPDHKASLDPLSFKAMVAGIRDVEQALGDGVKRPHVSELANRAVARKSLVALRDVVAGEKWDTGNLTVKRPGSGVCASEYWDWLGTAADRSAQQDSAPYDGQRR